jgi:hypothetical protein
LEGKRTLELYWASISHGRETSTLALNDNRFQVSENEEDSRTHQRANNKERMKIITLLRVAYFVVLIYSRWDDESMRTGRPECAAFKWKWERCARPLGRTDTQERG